MDIRALVMGLTFSLMWSSAFATGRVIVAHAPPLAALSLRFAISALLAIAVARALGQSWRLAPAQWRGVAVFGLCQNALYLGLNFVALQRVEASLAAIIASSMPLVVALLGRALRGERVAPLAALGLAAGFGGVALIMGGRLSGGADPWGIALCIAGAVALAWATLTVRAASAGGNLLMVVGLQMGVGAVILAAVSLATEVIVITPGWPLTLAFAYQILVPGLAATLLWFALIGRVGAVKAAAFHFLNPAFGVLIAAALLGERISPTDCIGVAVAGAGILAVQRARLRGA